MYSTIKTIFTLFPLLFVSFIVERQQYTHRNNMSMKPLSAKTAAALDASLMSTLGYKLEQLMELAGLSVAQAIYADYKPDQFSNVLVLVGPGNNGGDGLVAARHLKLFGYREVAVYIPKQGKNPFYANLQTQLKSFNVPVHTGELNNVLKGRDLVVDALFGFSGKPPLREPFNLIIDEIVNLQKRENVKLFAVDVPSGWDVDEGPVSQEYMPDALISLTAPKPCSAKLAPHVKHYLGGRFISKEIAEKWNFDVPQYQGVDQFVRL